MTTSFCQSLDTTSPHYPKRSKTPVVCFLALFVLIQCGASRQFVDPDTDALVPGTETSLRFRGFVRHITIYTPKDFSSEEAWPVIYYYHCFGGEPNTKIFQAVTQGKGYVLVGMNYVTTDYYETVNEKTASVAVKHFDEAREFISSLVKHKAAFMAGYSQGGYVTAQLGELRASQLNGLIMLGAGRNEYKKPPKYPDAMVGKPIFMGIGKGDYIHLPKALTTVDLYSRWRANVTIEIWENTGHMDGWKHYIKDPNRGKNLREWLKKYSQKNSMEIRNSPH